MADGDVISFRSAAATKFSLNVAINQLRSMLAASAAAGPSGAEAIACSILTDLLLGSGYPIREGTGPLTARQMADSLSSPPPPHTHNTNKTTTNRL